MNDRKSKNWQRLKFLLALVLVLFVISKTNLEILTSTMKQATVSWILIAALIFFGMTFQKALQYAVLLGRREKYWDVVKIVIWQNAISNFIASSAGIASYMTMLKAEQNVKLTRSGVTFIITKFGDLLAICLYLGVSGVLSWQWIGPLRWLTALLVVGMLLGLGAFVLTILWRESFVNFTEKILHWLRIGQVNVIQKGIEALRSLAQEDQQAIFAMLRAGVLLSMVYMTITMAFAWASIQIFNVDIGIVPIIYVASMMQLVSFIPIQVFGGLGVSEVTAVYLYGIFGVDQGEMSAIMLGLRALFYLLNAATLLYFPIRALFARKINT